jgi:hypothetical protein
VIDSVLLFHWLVWEIQCIDIDTATGTKYYNLINFWMVHQMDKGSKSKMNTHASIFRCEGTSVIGLIQKCYEKRTQSISILFTKEYE